MIFLIVQSVIYRPLTEPKICQSIEIPICSFKKIEILIGWGVIKGAIFVARIWENRGKKESFFKIIHIFVP